MFSLIISWALTSNVSRKYLTLSLSFLSSLLSGLGEITSPLWASASPSAVWKYWVPSGPSQTPRGIWRSKLKSKSCFHISKHPPRILHMPMTRSDKLIKMSSFFALDGMILAQVLSQIILQWSEALIGYKWYHRKSWDVVLLPTLLLCVWFIKWGGREISHLCRLVVKTCQGKGVWRRVGGGISWMLKTSPLHPADP